MSKESPSRSAFRATGTGGAILLAQSITNAGTWATRIGLILAVVGTTEGLAATAAVVAVDSVPRALLARRVGRWVRKFRPAQVFVIGSLGEAFLTLLCIPASHASVSLLFIAVFLRSIFSCTLSVTLQSATPLLFGRGEAMRRLNLALGLVNALAVIAGPVVGSVVWQAGGLDLLLRIDAASTIVAMLVLVPFLRRLGRWSSASDQVAEGGRGVRSRPLLMANAVAVVGGGIFNVLLPVYALSALGLSAAGLGMLFGFFGAGAIAVTLCGSVLASRLSAVVMYRAGFATSAVAMAGIASGITLPELFVFLAGTASALRAVGVQTRLQEVTEDSELPVVMSTFQAFTAWALAIGSLGGTALVSVVSPRTGIVAVTILSLAALLLAAFRTDRRSVTGR